MNCPAEDFRALFEFLNRNKFAGPVGDPNIAGAKNDGFRAERDHAGSFGAESYRAGGFAGSLFQELNDRRPGLNLKTIIRAGRVDFTDKLSVGASQLFDFLSDEVQHVVRFLAGDGPPFKREAAFSRDYILCRSALDYADVESCVRRLESFTPIALQLFGDPQSV